ncbi:histidine phosphatase family protein [Thiomicrorhabdus sp. ZW0627]|uniref:histidine phosphatase family protein n=1 Tax=Thiomicrorhabdus sp. ZW0627 TaxID=3039774 RepID=UPI002436AF67|nr:histidine phosphatase family protein [Thiomicrorhabdus sp. ZW0627]MDG6773715.1 histidine phosphatase family protein [Thiomicrorhabdus sp. ZW0627]
MKQPRLYLAFVRHGDYQQKDQVPSALQPYGLTNLGCEQAFESAIRIQQFAEEYDCEIDPTVVSSTLLRAWQTADYIAQGLQIPYQIRQTAKLVERSVGAAANLTVSEIEAILEEDPRYPNPPKQWKSDSDYKLPFEGAESLMQAGQRVADEITQTFSELSENAGYNTLKIMVGHGASFRHAAHILGVLEREEIRGLSMYYGVPVFFEYHPHETPAWRKVAGDWKVRQQASQHHFEESLD